MLSINNKYFYVLIAALFGTGLLYYAWQQEWIIFRHPSFASKITLQKNYSKKNVTLYLWHDKWLTEHNEIIWSLDDAENAKHLTRALLNVLHEEQCIKKKIHVEGAFTDQTNQELFLILDRSPFSKNMSIHQKLMITESVLKTLRKNDIRMPKIRFLANNQPLSDAHLDFSQSWPLEGF